MIEVERVNGQKLWINPELIKFMEMTPDTVITMMNDEKLILRTKVDEIIRKINQL
jgi:flagellar protein FlbD